MFHRRSLRRARIDPLPADDVDDEKLPLSLSALQIAAPVIPPLPEPPAAAADGVLALADVAAARTPSCRTTSVRWRWT